MKHNASTFCTSSVSFVVAVAFIAGCKDESLVDVCERGYTLAVQSEFVEAKSTLAACIARPTITATTHRRALIVLAWVDSNLDDEFEAAKSYDAAFQLSPPQDYREMVNASLTYRYANRAKDALKLSIAATEAENGKFAESMMMQYHLGWSYQASGMHAEAIEAFSRGIPRQTDFAYVYWRRALSHEALGDKEKTRSDLATAAPLFPKNESQQPTKQSLQIMTQEIAETYRRNGLSVPEAISRSMSR